MTEKSHKLLMEFVDQSIGARAIPALTWYNDGTIWTWDSGTCSRLKHFVYWFMSGGEVLYIGKATDLDSRMRTHWDDMNRYKSVRKLEGLADVADRNGDLSVWAVEVPPQDIGGHLVPNEDAVETAMIWHINPPVNLAKKQ